MKLKDMVELLSNNDACVVLKVKDGQEMNLISLGCFNGDEVMMRLTKGRDVTCTLFRKNGKSFSLGSKRVYAGHRSGVANGPAHSELYRE